MIDKREFISIASAILKHCELYVTDTLGAASLHCGIANAITNDGVLVDETGKTVYNFSDWNCDETMLCAINAKGLTVYDRGAKIELTCVREDEDFDLVKFFAVNNRQWEH